jgi:predicted DNA binding CopG/RHH family protein
MSLDDYEIDILEQYESGKLESLAPSPDTLQKYAEIAGATLKKNKRVNIRLSEHDLIAIQRKAIQEGLPYQTLIASLIHKYTTGLLVEKQKAG